MPSENTAPRHHARRALEPQRAILRDLGVALHIPGVMAILSLPVPVIFGEAYAVAPFIATAVASFVPGQILYWLFRGSEEMRLRHAMVTVVLAWVSIPVVGILPFVLVASHLATVPGTAEATLIFQQPWNALFESVSGFTGTGLTVAMLPADLPRSLQWWRSLTEWVGGVGVIVLMLSVFHPAGETMRLFYAEARDTRVVPRLVSTIRTIWWIYLLYTALGVLLLRVAGATWWEAVNHALTGISTGGFTVSNGNAAQQPLAAQVVMLVLVVMGALSFTTHYHVLVKRQGSLLWRDIQNRALFTLLVFGALLLAFENRWATGTFMWFDSMFQWTSALCTAGFQTVRIEHWSATAQLLLSIGMIIGGAAGATTGGLKLRRVTWLAAAAAYRIGRISRHPWLLMEHKPLAGSHANAVSGPHVEAAAILTVLWLVVVGWGTLVLVHVVGSGVPLNTVILEAASATGNVGLSAGITRPDLPWVGKLTLIVLMWVGRLEIVPVLVLFASIVRPRGERIT